MTAMKTVWTVCASIARQLRDDSGQDLIEYAMLTGLIVLVTVATVNSLGDTVDTVLWEPLEPIVAQF